MIWLIIVLLVVIGVLFTVAAMRGDRRNPLAELSAAKAEIRAFRVSESLRARRAKRELSSNRRWIEGME